MKKNRGFYPLAVAVILAAAFLVTFVSPASADDGFHDGQVVYATGNVTAVYDPCGKAGWRGTQFTAAFGEALTVTAHPTLGVSRCGAYRVVNAAGNTGWVFSRNLGVTPPKTIIQKINEAGWCAEDLMYNNFNKALARRGSNYFYWKSPSGTWGRLLWDGVTEYPRPYWK